MVNMMLHPFDPKLNKPRKNADGSVSTEITRTVQTPNGWVNVPSLWWADGDVVRDFGSMSDDQLADFAMRYEQTTGQTFPRYRDLGEAESAAKGRSNAGGGTRGQITAPPLPVPPSMAGNAIARALMQPPKVPPMPMPFPTWRK